MDIQSSNLPVLTHNSRNANCQWEQSSPSEMSICTLSETRYFIAFRSLYCSAFFRQNCWCDYRAAHVNSLPQLRITPIKCEHSRKECSKATFPQFAPRRFVIFQNSPAEHRTFSRYLGASSLPQTHPQITLARIPLLNRL